MTPRFQKSVVKAPDEYERLGNDFVEVIFLGGGISNCWDWQTEMEGKLTGLPLLQLNPRRDNFDVAKESESVAQIHWEDRHLKRSNSILFWFPNETLCPITLFELGKYLLSDKNLFVGVHPEYKRKLDVYTQVAIERPQLQIVNTVDDLAQQIWDFYGYDRETGDRKPRKVA